MEDDAKLQPTFEGVAKQVATTRERFSDIKATIKRLDRRQLHFALRKVVSSVNPDDILNFGHENLPLMIFQDIAENANKEEAAFDPYQARSSFLDTWETILALDEDIKLEDLVRAEAKVIRKTYLDCEGLKLKKSECYVEVCQGLTDVLSSCYRLLAPSSCERRDLGTINLIAQEYHFKVPPFSQSFCPSDNGSGRTESLYSKASQVLANLDPTKHIPGLSEIYDAYMYNPHLTYILGNRSHPLLFRDAADVARRGDGTISEALHVSPSLQPGWTSPFAKSRLTSILDAPCTTKDCPFHGKIMALAEMAREDGNKAFRQGRISSALEYYGRAVGLVHWSWSNKTTFLSNAAQCLLKLNNYEAAKRACTAALEIDPNNYKAWQRRSVAKEELGNIAAAVGDAQRALSVCRFKNVEAKVLHDMENRLSSLRLLISDEDITALARFARSGHDELALTQGKSLLHALTQQLNATEQSTDTGGDNDNNQAHRESLSVDLSTALTIYSSILARRAFPVIENGTGDCTCSYISAFQYEAAVTILENTSTALLLTPNHTEARVLRVMVAYAIGELDLVHNDILLMKDSSSKGGYEAVCGIEECLKERIQKIHDDLETTGYCKTTLRDNNDANTLHGGKFRHKLDCKKFWKNMKQVGRTYDKERFRNRRHMQEEMIEARIVPTFRDSFWSSLNPIQELQARWNALDAAEQCGITSLKDLDAIVERLATFRGDGQFDLRGPFAASQARVDKESLIIQFIHEAWARAMSGDTGLSYGCALARSTAPELVPRFVPMKACIPLPEASIYGPTLSCGLESVAINDSAPAPWRMEIERSYVSWADAAFTVIESTSGVVSVSLSLRCSSCRQYRRMHAFNRSTLRGAHSRDGAVTCRDCQSGIRHMRGMYHLGRTDLHEKALRIGVTGKLDLIATQERSFLTCRLDWMTAALDLFEERLRGEAAPSTGCRVHKYTSDIVTVCDDGDEADEAQDRIDDQEDTDPPELNALRAKAVEIMMNCCPNFPLDDLGTFLDKNASCCAQCGAGGAKIRCPGCRCMRYCSQQCYYDGWKASHKNCCMPPGSVAQIFDRLLTEKPSIEEGEFLADMVSSTLTESERHRRKLIKARPDAARKVASLLESVEHVPQNSAYLEELATLLNAICNHQSGRKGMGIQGLLSVGASLHGGGRSKDFPHVAFLMKVLSLFK